MQSVSNTTNVVSSNPFHGEMYSIQHYVIQFVTYLRQVGGFDLPFYLAVETSGKGIGLIRAIDERWNLILRFNINLLNN
jgi:hypothetical protein